jgi:hypothetical protein
MAVVPDPAKTLKSFRVAQVSSAGAKRGTGRGAFVDSLLDAVDTFYDQTLVRLKPRTGTPPRPRPSVEPPPVEPVPRSLTSKAISSQDGPQTGTTAASADDAG